VKSVNTTVKRLKATRLSHTKKIAVLNEQKSVAQQSLNSKSAPIAAKTPDVNGTRYGDKKCGG